MIAWTNPRKIGGNYFFNFKKQKDNVIPALDASSHTINYIKQNYPEPYILYLSGGVDSQAMLYAWMQSGVVFDTFSAVYNNGLNNHDLDSLREFSNIHGAYINYVDFDLKSFLENEHDSYANKYQCGSPQITTFMKLSDMAQKGTVIMSGNFIGPQGIGIPDRNNFSLFNYGVKTKKNIVPWFFLETQELAYAFPTPANLSYTDEYSFKVAHYIASGFPVIAQCAKYNGFEKIKELYDTNPPRMPTFVEQITRISRQVSNRNFDLLYRNKYEAKFYRYKYNVLC